MIVVAILAATIAASAADVDETQFRYTRTLDAAPGPPVRFEPDGALYGHTRVGFPDLRIMDAEGTQVPWRTEPKPAAVPLQRVPLVARGRRDGTVSVVVDRGEVGPVIDRIQLDVPDRVFVGTVVVQGSATGAEGSYATLSTTPIYAVRGAVDARSTTAVFPATDYRYLLVTARGVSQITGASVARDPEQAPLETVPARTRRLEEGRATVIGIDLGYPKVPVDAVRIRSSTPRFVRPVTVEGSNDGESLVVLARSQIARFRGADLSRLPIAGRHRFLRVIIRNGDDLPLDGVRVVAQAMPRPLLLAGGHAPPFRLLYGASAVPAPTYDFAQLPAAATGFERARTGTLGAERVNERFEPPADTRTFFERNDYLVDVLLVVGAIVAAVGGFLALRRRTGETS